MKFLDAVVSRERTVLTLLVGIMLAGISSYLSIPIESDPDVSVPVIVVIVPHEGISPEDSERLLIRPLELELKTIEGIEELNAYAAEGQGTVVIEFDSSFEPDQAMTDVREAVDRAKIKMPQTAEEPILNEISASDFPIVTVSVAGEGVDERTIYQSAEALKRKIESIPGVLEAKLTGAREEVLEAIIDPEQLQRLGISSVELLCALGRNNRLIAAGSVDTGRGRFAIKIPSVIDTAEDVLSVPLIANADGVITVRDVVTLRRTFKDASGFTRANGAPAMAIEVSKRSGTSLIDVVDRVKEVVESEKRRLPQALAINYLADQAPETRSQIETLQGNISTAMFLVLTVVVAAVGVRSGLLVAFGIPFSFLFAFIFVNALGYTYNFMVMFGMLLGLGMLIDGAIVVVELADRNMVSGMPAGQAYLNAAKRMFWPIIASVGTTLAAFLPLMLWPGVTGQFMRYLPVTVFAVLAGSLLYALIFAPVLGGIIRPKTERRTDPLKDARAGMNYAALPGLLGVYGRVLMLVTGRPIAVLFGTVAVLYLIVRAYGASGLGAQFFVDVEPSFTGVAVSAKGNYSAEEIRDLVTGVERRVMDAGEIESIYTSAGSGSAISVGSGRSGDQIGSMFIELTDRQTRTLDGWRVIEGFRDAIARMPGLRAEIQEQERGPPVGKDIQLQLQAEDLGVLAAETRRVRAYLETLPTLRDVDDTAPVPAIEWEMNVDREKAAMMGADVASVGSAVQLMTNGVLIGRFRPDDAEDEIDIRLRYPEDARGFSKLDSLRVSTREGQSPISSFVTREARPKVSTIFRQDGQRIMYVRANVVPGALVEQEVSAIQTWLNQTPLAPGVRAVFRGANEEQAKTMQFISSAFSLALLLMALLLVTQFNSFYQTLLVLSSVLMSTVGVLLGLMITQDPFSAIMTGVGIVALAGIIVNNNIVLIDTFNEVRALHPGWSLAQVATHTGCLRLRPVFLTTFTTGFGLLPMAMGVSIDLIGRTVEVGGPIASFWTQLASAIVSGLSFATVLTLLVTPAMLALPEALRSARQRLPWRRRLPEADPTQA
ncbi:MAG: efflux RND transporter permease subunit [Pseudomonadales bacterium]